MNDKLLVFILSALLIVIPSGTIMADQWYERTESFTVDDISIEFLSFENIDFTEFDYRGVDGAVGLDITVTYRVEADNRETADEVLSRFELKTDTMDNRVDVRLEHPKQRDDNFINRFINRDWREWKVVMTVTGPSMANVDIEAEFSDLQMERMVRGVTLETDFTESVLRNIEGTFIADCEFGSLTVYDLAGTFEVNGEFGDIDLEVTGLDNDSSLSIEFGNADLDLPAGTGVSFVTQKSFGGVDFDISEPVTLNDRGSRRVMINDGGLEIELKASFGNISVSDSAPLRSSRTREQTGGRNERSERRSSELLEPAPRFTEGTVRSISFRGYELLNYVDLAENLGIREGQSYTREQLDDAVHDLPSRNRFVESAWYRIDPSGIMTVWIDETELYDFDGDGLFTFNRAAGFGLGAEVTLSSMVGPFSELSLKGIHNWGTKDWTYEVSGEKRFFTRYQLAVGGSYRRAYESSLDWAIPAEDRDANSFILGLEINNLYQVEGSTAFISQSLGDVLTISAAYFDEEFSSLTKNTDWSLFNHRHTKAPNAPLDPLSVGTATGMRYAAEIATGNGISHTVLRLEAEKTFEDNTTINQYTRYLGTLSYRQILYAHQAVLVRFAGGYSDDVLPDQKAFRLGGLNTLRGFAHGMVPDPPAGADGFDYHGGGNRMFLANIEYSLGNFYDGLFDDIGLTMFADVGGVWRDGEDMTPEGLKRDVGIGLNLGGFLDPVDIIDTGDDGDRLIVNWAVPVGNESHKSRWTVNFSRPF